MGARPALLGKPPVAPGDCVVVTFHTYSGLMTDEGGEKIIRHVDTYFKGHYSPTEFVQTTLAVGEEGFEF